jgi:hypothetical protein
MRSSNRTPHVVQSRSWHATQGLARKTTTYVWLTLFTSSVLTSCMELVVNTVKDYLNKMLRTGANSTAPSIPTIPVPVPLRHSKVDIFSVCPNCLLTLIYFRNGYQILLTASCLGDPTPCTINIKRKIRLHSQLGFWGWQVRFTESKMRIQAINHYHIMGGEGFFDKRSVKVWRQLFKSSPPPPTWRARLQLSTT